MARRSWRCSTRAGLDRLSARYPAAPVRLAAFAPLSLIALCVTAPFAFAQDFPSRPLRLVVGFPPGGGADGAARAVAQKLNDVFGQPVVVDNRAGAGGNVAAEIVAHGVPDGHTLLVTSPGPVVINPSLYASLPYDPARELAPVTLIAAGANVLAVHPAVAANSVQQLIALARSRPDALNYASSGIGTIPHLSGELFRIEIGRAHV